jgi:hypothetical protein
MKEHILSLTRSWLCKQQDEESTSEDEQRMNKMLDTIGTRTIQNDSHSDYVADITIRQSKRLAAKNGTIPEEMAAIHIEAALHLVGIGCRIRYGFPEVEPPEEDSSCDGPTHDWYKEQVRGWDKRGEDTNLLLVASEGGGCGQWWDEKVATAPALFLNERRPWSSEGSDRWHSNIQAILHEMGHTLSAHHDHDDEQKGNQYPGNVRLDHESQVWRYTPTVFNADGGVNLCGSPQPDREEYNHYKKVRLHTYTDCAGELFKGKLSEENE